MLYSSFLKYILFHDTAVCLIIEGCFEILIEILTRIALLPILILSRPIDHQCHLNMGAYLNKLPLEPLCKQSVRF